jgi:hypothetical protein
MKKYLLIVVLFYLFSCSSERATENVLIEEVTDSDIHQAVSINANNDHFNIYDNLTGRYLVFNLCNDTVIGSPYPLLKKSLLDEKLNLFPDHTYCMDCPDSYSVRVPGYIAVDSSIILICLIYWDACIEAQALVFDYAGQFLGDVDLSFSDTCGAGYGVCCNEKLYLIGDKGFELHGYFKIIPCDDEGMVLGNAKVNYRRYHAKMSLEDTRKLVIPRIIDKDSSYFLPSKDWGKSCERDIYCLDVL